MDRAEGRRWSKIIGREADAVEARCPSRVISRKIVGRIAVRIILADEVQEVEELFNILPRHLQRIRTSRHDAGAR